MAGMLKADMRKLDARIRRYVCAGTAQERSAVWE
jgi:hypothetical protein